MDHQTTGRTRIRPAWIVAAALAMLVLVAFGVPLVSLLYVGILLLCPLLMVGMHGGHGQAQSHVGHAQHEDGAGSTDPRGSGTGPAAPPLEGGRT